MRSCPLRRPLMRLTAASGRRDQDEGDDGLREHALVERDLDILLRMAWALEARAGAGPAVRGAG